MPLPEVEARLEAARGKLLAARARRVRPGRDDKLLCSWNALMIGALARASRVFGEPSWLSDAQQAADFIRRAMWRDGRLLATYKDGRAHLNAYLDDHAFLLAALIELMQTAFRAQDLAWAIEIADALLARFEDRAGGGFFFTSDDHESAAAAAEAGTRQCDTGRQRHRRAGADRARPLAVGPALPATAPSARCVHSAASWPRGPAGFSSLLVALEACLEPPAMLLLRGDPAACLSWQRARRTAYRPSLQTLNLSQQQALPGALAKPHDAGAGPVTAWLCRGAVCLPPLHALADLDAVLAS